MRILSIDPATTTGWCVIEFDRDNDTVICIIDYGFFTINTLSDYEGDHCILMQQTIKNLINKYDVNEICLEDYFFSRRACQGANKNLYYRGAIMIKCREMNLVYKIINIYNWKKFINGKSTVSKEMKRKYKSIANKMCTVISLYDTYDIKFPNQFIQSGSDKKRLVNFKMDIVDSIAIGIYFMKEKFSINEPQVIDCTSHYEDYNNNSLKPLYDEYK